MSGAEQNKDTPTQQEAAARPFDPGHVMTRKHYEELARQAANQK